MKCLGEYLRGGGGKKERLLAGVSCSCEGRLAVAWAEGKKGGWEGGGGKGGREAAPTLFFLGSEESRFIVVGRPFLLARFYCCKS